MKKLMLALMVAFAATAEAFIGGINYSFNSDGTAAINGYDLSNPPTKVDAAEVEKQGQKYTVTAIGIMAFDGCDSLESVSLPFVTTIKMYAFDGCTALKSLTVNFALKETWESNKSSYGINGTTVNPEVKFYTTTPTIGGIIYGLDTQSKTATITGYEGSPTQVDVSEVEYFEQKYSVTSVGENAFLRCSSLTSVLLPNVTTIGDSAFYGCGLTEVSLPNVTMIRMSAFSHCENLTSVFSPFVTTIEQSAFSSCRALSNLVVNIAMKAAIEANGTTYYGIPNDTTITYYDGYSYSVLEKAEYQMTMKSGDTAIDEDKYKKSCEFFGLTPIEKPQVVKEGEVAVKQTELQAAKAEAVSIADGVVSLGVTVNTNGNFTAETKSWQPVELKSENVEVKDGKIVISIPVSDKSGFMILQSGDAKVPNAAVTHEPWYTPIE